MSVVHAGPSVGADKGGHWWPFGKKNHENEDEDKDKDEDDDDETVKKKKNKKDQEKGKEANSEHHMSQKALLRTVDHELQDLQVSTVQHNNYLQKCSALTIYSSNAGYSQRC
jgi:hypothetical protein